MAEITVSLRPEGDQVTIGLTAFLGQRFGLYRDVVAACGARYVASERVNVLPLDQVPVLLPALQTAGLTVSCTAEVAARLREGADAARSLMDAGDERLKAADERLAARGKALYPFQRSGVRWLAPRPAALLADDMGLGKTVQLLLALPDRAKAVVISPSAVLLNWSRETLAWRPDLIPVVIKGKAAFRWPRPGEVILTTYGSLPEDDQLPAPVETYLLADEAHGLKNPKTTRAKRWQALRMNVVGNGGRVWLATGTPLLNRPPELWAVLGAAGLAEQAFGSWNRFVSMFHGYRGRFGYEWGTEVSPEAPLALQKVSLHRRRIDVLPDLPVKRHRMIEVNGLPASTIRACDEIVEKLRERGIDLDALDADADLGSLIAGPIFALMSKARAQLATAKLPHAIELIEEYEDAGEPVVLVSAHKEPVDVIGGRPGWAKIHGETSPEDRAKIAERFQAGELKGVALTFKAGGVGITLTRAAHMVMVDQDWTPALIRQAEDRIVRIGQTRGCLITVIVASHPLDKRVNELLSEKRALIEGAIEASAVSASYQAEDPARALHAAAEAAANIVESTVRPAAEAATAAPARPAGGYTRDTLPQGGEPAGKFRFAANLIEHHAGRAILTLADCDTDRAGQKNGSGFNKPDTDFGHSLADTLRKYGRMSDRQWAAAVRMVVKYHGQIGKPGEPAESEEWGR